MNCNEIRIRGAEDRIVDWAFAIFGSVALYSLWPFLLVQKRPQKGHKESELAWMGLGRIVSASCGHPALRQRILWELGWQAVRCFL